jgi:hypothetical protein
MLPKIFQERWSQPVNNVSKDLPVFSTKGPVKFYRTIWGHISEDYNHRYCLENF